MNMFHIIDDEKNVRDILKKMIDCFGYRVICFESADIYLEWMNSPEYHAPVAILTDNIMPGTTGYELISKVRTLMPMQKIIMISGTPDSKCINRDGLCYTLLKPFRMNALKELLDLLIKCDKKPSCRQYQTECEVGLAHHCPFAAKPQTITK